MVSLPPRPQITSAPLVPLRVSLPAVPVIVQPRLLFTVVDSASVLSPVTSSGSLADTVEVAVIVPAAEGVTVMVTVAEPAAGMPPSAHVTVGAVITQEPCDEVTASMLRAAPDRVV